MTRDKLRIIKYTPKTEEVTDGMILALWTQRLDTFDIAKHLHVPESYVHNRLLHIREAAQ